MTTMIMLRGLLTGLTLTLAALLAPASHSAEVAGIPFDEQMKLGDAPLVLNGTGVRSKFMFKVYALGLYLPRKAADAAQAIAQSGPKRIRIVTLRDVGAEVFLEGLTKGVEKNHSAAEMAALKARLETFSATLKGLGELTKGSVVTLDLLPGGVTQLSANGAPLGKAIAGEDFYRALLRVWLGDNPVQGDLKRSLLGQGG